MSYAIAGGQKYNMVITHPIESIDQTGKPMLEVLSQMKSYYAGWDPW
jgi:hypothetical protein